MTAPTVDPAQRDGWALVTAAQNGDQQAFGQLYTRYVDVVFRFVLYRVADKPLAEDLTSETFLRALRRIGSVSYQGRDIGAWFITIARNLILDYLKSSRHRLEIPVRDIRDTEVDSLGPEDRAVADFIATELHGHVTRLCRDQQQCITHRFFQGLSVSETAAAMDRNPSAVKALQYRAIRNLAEQLSRKGSDDHRSIKPRDRRR
jgi:RNA polymerase sigma-70 factor (ECF subfamily)